MRRVNERAGGSGSVRVVLRDTHHPREASRFALQWHLTHACEMHCRHCYDRSKLSPLGYADAVRVLDDLVAFCARHGVIGSVILSGGNPFLHPSFFEIYRAAIERRLGVGILGNPVPRADLERLVAIAKPRYYQVSLEGLESHNDSIRGPGSYRAVIDFLPVLKELGIESYVMVTLTRGNVEEIVPLGRLLAGRVDHLCWNRLSQVGEGAALGAPSRDQFVTFLRDYILARVTAPHLMFKDNLVNIPRHQLGLPLYGGCTGYGCGAAFNFVALLPNGDVHACRKFPSKIGNVLEDGLEAAYQSDAASAYRRGCTACDGCAIRSRCGGCLATAHGSGLDALHERDPYCFWDERDEWFPEARVAEIPKDTRRAILAEHRARSVAVSGTDGSTSCVGIAEETGSTIASPEKA